MAVVPTIVVFVLWLPDTTCIVRATGSMALSTVPSRRETVRPPINGSGRWRTPPSRDRVVAQKPREHVVLRLRCGPDRLLRATPERHHRDTAETPMTMPR